MTPSAHIHAITEKGLVWNNTVQLIVPHAQLPGFPPSIIFGRMRGSSDQPILES
ncbi:predicted protein [Botrytis cinerea T4]|uniref:Uncharacterized protein n=1 Tax=Botryotinia fuckeliana (strain T4) TaxID=999810 RepID=G2XVR8_BOTF4|nr:predicted protein [Botrytis cinerea T4]